MAMPDFISGLIKPAYRRVFFGLWISLCSYVAFAEGEHRLEFGFGAGGQSLNHYRGSKERETVVLPFPIVIYSGDFLKIDEEDGLRGEFFANHEVEFNLSGDLELRSSSKDNLLRAGMPELDTAMQLGPEFNLNLSGKDFSEGWALRVPLRMAFTVTLDDPQIIGYTFNPKLTYKRPGFFAGWRLKSDVALLYATEKFHDYYYQIDEEFVASERPLFDAKGGYSGAYLKLGFLKRHRNWLMNVSLRYDYLANAKFVDSPLVETENYFSISFGVAYLFRERRW